MRFRRHRSQARATWLRFDCGGHGEVDGLLLTVTSERASWASLRRFGLAANVVNMADSSAQDSYKVKKSEVALLCFSRV